MLQRTPRSLVYLSADELGITERERAGLIEVRDDLASGRVKHEPKAEHHNNLSPRATGFNMAYWRSRGDCGTAHCIGGFLKARDVIDNGYSDPLNCLFYMGIEASRASIRVADVNPAQAVRAIDMFLCGAAEDSWKLALADEPA
jgi:hypothetical protein